MKACKNCLKEIKAGTYCDNKCQQKYQQMKIVDKWLNGEDNGLRSGFRLKSHIRRYLIEEANNECSKCGWNEINPNTGLVPLEIDHIDGDCTNTNPNNLEVICPNCHSLTPTFRALNKGKGNRKRLKYFNLGS